MLLSGNRAQHLSPSLNKRGDAEDWGELPDTEATPMITPSEVLEFLYCKRFTYFLNVMKIKQYEEKRYKVQLGKEIHRKRIEENREYLRKKIPIERKEVSVYLASPKLRVRGIVDEVLWLKDGTLAPIDYKFTPYREYTFKTHRVQIVLYGMLVEETYGMPVNRGYISYIRGGSKTHEILFSEGLKGSAVGIIDEIFQIIATEKIPPRTSYKVRCMDCCYKNICV